jgi:hypothetical protein
MNSTSLAGYGEQRSNAGFIVLTVIHKGKVS